MKPKIIIDREPVGSEEILSRRNFQRLVSDAKLMQKPFFTSTWFISSIAATAVLTIALLVFYNGSGNETETPKDNTAMLKAADSNIVGNSKMIYTEDSPCINPPVKGAEKKASIYTVSNEKGATIAHPSGTLIKIPPAAVQDENGQTVSGKYDIHYREFHSLEEIILSGIPMTYDSAGTQYHFESAGMIDIRASQNGKALQIAPNKPIEIQMASTRSESRFNHYYLDTIQRNWIYLGKEKTGKKEQSKAAISDSIGFPANLSSEQKENTSIVVNQKALITPEIVALQKSLDESRLKLESTNQQKPIEPQKVNVQKHHFNIDVNPAEFPELSAFKNTLFEVGSENNNFSRDWYDQHWNSVTLREHIKGKSFKLELVKIANGKPSVASLIVYPVYEGKNYDEALLVYENQLKQYNTSLRTQQEILAQKEKELKECIARSEKELAKQLKAEEAERKRRAELRARELINSAGTGNNNVLEVRYPANYTPQQIADFTTTRTFSVMQFGFYNSDCPKKLPDERVLAALFLDQENNKMILAPRVFLVDQSNNISYSYYQNTLSRFGFNPQSTNSILIILNDGRAAYFKAKDFESVPDEEKSFTFMMHVSEYPISKESDLKKILSL